MQLDALRYPGPSGAQREHGQTTGVPAGAGAARAGARAPLCGARRGTAPGQDEHIVSSVSAAAHELGITETTARQHLSGLYRRTGCLNAAQAAFRLGAR